MELEVSEADGAPQPFLVVGVEQRDGRWLLH